VRRRHREIFNSQREWEPAPKPEAVPARDVVIGRDPTGHESLRPVLSEPSALHKIGQGTLVEIEKQGDLPIYGRASTIADTLADGRFLLAKWVRRMIGWHGRQVTPKGWAGKVLPMIEERLAQRHTPIVRVVTQGHRVQAHVSIGELTLRVVKDRHGVALWKPKEREVLPPDCSGCGLIESCKKLPTATGTALLWRRLGLVEMDGTPTRRGRLVSFFHQGDGLAIAAALEDESYPIDELVYDLANLDAGFRFCGDGNRFEGRLAMVCHERYKLLSIAGYLENGVPPKYGYGAEDVVSAVHKSPQTKHSFVTDFLGAGDIDRIIIEWRSMMRQISHAPDLDWPRWMALKAAARTMVQETESPTLTDLPDLEYHQTKRVEHRLLFRRH
jgi:hypothetical protein